MKKINISKCVSMILTITIIITAFSAVPVLSNDTEQLDVQGETDIADNSEVTVVTEDISKRTENSKEYILSDGTRMITAYSHAVHYEHGGQWMEIDNRLVHDEVSDIYRTSNGDVGFAFSEKAATENMVSVENGEYTLVFGLANVKSASGASVAKQSTHAEKTAQSILNAQSETIDSAQASANISNSVMYENALDGAHIEYVLEGSRLRENIILTKKLSKYEYGFTIKADGMTAALESDGSITFSADGNVVFTIPAPFMYDAVGERSTSVSYSLSEVKGLYFLTLTASADWINDESRQFPVTIDPDIEIANGDSNVTYATAVNGVKSGTSLDIGRTGTDEYCSYVKINELPVLPAGSIIVDAELDLTQSAFTLGYDGAQSTAVKLGVKKVTGAWNSSTTSFSTVSTDSRILDYITVGYSDIAQTHSLDITSAVIDWYDTDSYISSAVPDNYGLFVYRIDSDMNDGIARFISADTANSTDPLIRITYRDARGISGSRSYQSIGVSGADTAYINDFSGNLVYEHTDYVSTADVMTLKVSHVYNSVTAYYGFNYMNTECANGLYSMQIHTRHYSNMYVGRGWKLNIYESLYIDPSTGYMIYNDPTGMEYYLKNTDGVYKDEDNLGLSVSVSGSTYTMSYDDGSDMTKVFYNGMLYKVTDEDGNYTELVYNTTDGKPADYSRLINIKQYSKETDTIQTLLTFAYSSDNYLSTVTDKYGNVTTYTYTDGYLTGVDSTDGKSLNYTYNTTSNAALSQIYNEKTDYGVNIAYESRKVSSYTEFTGFPGISSVLGDRVRIERNGKNKTATYVYDNKTNSGTYEEKNHTTYVFNYDGKTVNTYSTDGGDLNTASDGITLYSSAAYSYNESEDASDGLLINSSGTGVRSHNLLTNSGAESQFEGWYTSTLTSDDTVTTVSTSGYYRNGSKAFAITGNSGGATSLYREVALKPETTYTLSAYIKTDGTLIGVMEPPGVRLSIEDSNSEAVLDSYGEWERISVTYTTPESSTSSVSVYIFATLENALGTVYIDDIVLEEGGAPGVHNLLENSSFDAASTLTEESTGAAIVSGGIGGSRALRLNSYLSTAACATLTSGNVNLPSGQTFVLSGWAKAQSVALREGVTFALEVYIAYSDYTEETFTLSFCPDVTGWQYVNASVIPGNTNSGIMYLEVNCLYGNNYGTALFDNISLVKSDVMQYEYNEKGWLTESTDGTSTFTYEYDTNGKLIKVTNEKGEDVTYDHENETVTDSAAALKSDTDKAGNTVETVVTPTQGYSGLKQRSSAIYTDASRTKVASSTNINGITTSYTYDTDDRVMTQTVSGTTVNYRYNDDGTTRMSYISGVASADFVYENGQLTKVTRGGYTPDDSIKRTQDFGYTYDSFGALTALTASTDAGSRTLAAYAYAGYGGELERVTYANGQYVDYTYNSMGQVSQVSVNGTLTYSYTYDDNGALTKAQDLANGTEYSYYYDDDGTLAKSVCSTSSSTLKTFSKKDDDGRVKTSYYEYDYTPYTYSFLYCDEDETYAKNNDELLRKVTMPSGAYLLYGYDDLLRRPYAKTYTNSGVLVNDTLVRFTANGEYTTDLISSYRIGNTTAGERVFTYTYDAMGNISQINEGDDDAQSTAHKYIYDEQNQLVVDVDYSAGCTRVYVYDTYGNIRSKAELEGTGYTSYLSAYTAMTEANTDTYTYGDSTWLDLLTAYNGNAITYDASGNPLTYYNGMTFTWGNVRQLFSLVKSDGTQVSYKYNMDGIRTEKTVGSVTTTYTVAGCMLLREKRGNTTYDYYYDENGSIVGMKVGYNTYYYFGKNAQGDICAVYDGTGAQVASLTYDAYGNTVSVTNPNGLYIPFRYRGYYFDEETGFYYLQSRYYDPETGRFINADDVGYLGESNYLNLFAYCGNNPVMFVDSAGTMPEGFLNSWPEYSYTLSIKQFYDFGNELIKVLNSMAEDLLPKHAWLVELAVGLGGLLVSAVCPPAGIVMTVLGFGSAIYSGLSGKNMQYDYLMDFCEMCSDMYRLSENDDFYGYRIHLLNGYGGAEAMVALIRAADGKPIEQKAVYLHHDASNDILEGILLSFGLQPSIVYLKDGFTYKRFFVN